MFFTTFYLGLIISPMTIIVSGFKFNHIFIYIFHFIFLYACFGGACHINYRFAGESINFFQLFIHPSFVIIPIILNVLMYFSLYRYNKNHSLEKNENQKMFDNDNIDDSINKDTIMGDNDE